MMGELVSGGNWWTEEAKQMVELHPRANTLQPEVCFSFCQGQKHSEIIPGVWSSRKGPTFPWVLKCRLPGSNTSSLVWSNIPWKHCFFWPSGSLYVKAYGPFQGDRKTISPYLGNMWYKEMEIEKNASIFDQTQPSKTSLHPHKHTRLVITKDFALCFINILWMPSSFLRGIPMIKMKALLISSSLLEYAKKNIQRNY